MKNKKPSEIISRGATGEIVAPLNLNLPPDLVQLTKEWSGLSHAEKIADTKKRPPEDRFHLLQSVGGVCKNAIQVVREFRALIEVCRDELIQSGRRAPVEGKPTWTEFITATFGFSARRMQQLLAEGNPSRTSPKPQSPGRPKKTGQTTGPNDGERTNQVMRLAIKLARRLIEQGLADRFPEATEILDIVGTKAEARPSTSASSGNGASCSSPPERKHVSPLPKPRLAVPEGSPEQARGCDFQPQEDCYVCGTGISFCALHEPQVRALIAERGIDEVDASHILKEQFARRAEKFSKTA